MHNNLIIADDIRAALRDEVISALHATLVPVDCQTCGEEILDNDDLTLAVDDLNIGAWASLHHADCRPSEWSRHSQAEAESQQSNLTWRAKTLVWEAAKAPMILVNPSCEAAILTKEGTWRRQWRISTLNRFVRYGFAYGAQQISLPRPVAGLDARLELDPARVTVTSSDDGHGIAWNSGISDPEFALAHSRGYFVIGVTTALDPKTESIAENMLNQMVQRGEIVYASAPVRSEPRDAEHSGSKPNLDVDRMSALMELIRRRTGTSVGRNERMHALLLYLDGGRASLYYELGHLERPKGNNLPVLIVLLAGLYAAEHGPVHVMAHAGTTARRLTEACRQVLGPDIFPVSRVGEPSFMSERRISIGTYKEFADARARFDDGLTTSTQARPLAIGVDPLPEDQRGTILRRYARLIEL